MQEIRYACLSVVVFTPPERLAILRAWQYHPWERGTGTASILTSEALEKMALPPIARYPLQRAGVCMYEYTRCLTRLLEEIGGSDLAWWGWPESGITLLAAGWPYQRVYDDPLLRVVLHRLSCSSFSLPRMEPRLPLTFPLFLPDAERAQHLS